MNLAWWQEEWGVNCRASPEDFFIHPLPPWGCLIWCTNAIALSMGQLPFQIA